MDTVVYIVRHVQAEGNLYRIFHGHTDGDITDLGKKQCEKLTKRFEKISLSAILSSDLTRAMKTAKAVKGDKDIPFDSTPLLREIHAGIWEGQNFEGLGDIYPEEYRSFQNGEKNVRFGGGETIGEVTARMRKAVDKFVSLHKGEEIAVVSHGCAIRSLLSDYAKETVIWGTNASVSRVVYPEDSEPFIEYMWDDSHLEDARSVKLP